jgi:hypothetical protein
MCDVLTAASGSVVWIIPYESVIQQQHNHRHNQIAIHHQTLQDCLQRLVAAYSRINTLEVYESQAATSFIQLQRTLDENIDLHRRLKLRSLPITRCIGVQAHVAGDIAAAACASASAAAHAVHHVTSLVRSDLASVMASASQLVFNLEQKLSMLNQHVLMQDEQIADLILQIERQKEMAWQQQRQQELQHEKIVNELTSRFHSSYASSPSPSPSAAAAAAAAAALSVAKEEISFLQSSLAKENGK